MRGKDREREREIMRGKKRECLNERQREQEQTARESRLKYLDRGKDKESEKVGTRHLMNVLH